MRRRCSCRTALSSISCSATQLQTNSGAFRFAAKHPRAVRAAEPDLDRHMHETETACLVMDLLLPYPAVELLVEPHEFLGKDLGAKT